MRPFLSMPLSHPRFLLFTLAAIIGVHSTSLACGPFFPATVIDHGDAPLLTPIGRDFSMSLARLRLPAPTFPYVTLSSTETERLDLIAAGASEAVLARHTELRAQLAALGDAARQAPPPPPATDKPPAFAGAPKEFELYLRGARQWLGGHPDAARATFLDLLKLPPAKRRYKSTWAAFSLGQIAASGETPDIPEAARRFSETRTLAAAGFIDSCGLATASLGLEAQLHYKAKAFLPAAELYLQHYANGDPSALNSLLFTLTATLEQNDEATLRGFARSPTLRSLIAARILATRVTVETSYVSEPDLLAASRWLDLLEAEKISDAAEAESFALVAYRLGNFNDTRRWLALAPSGSAPARWLRAKLALLDGRVDDALVLLSDLVREDASAFHDLRVDAADSSDFICETDSRAATQSIQGALGALRLARRDYAESTRLLLAGGYWSDAAYVAERVLTASELRDLAGTLPDNTPHLGELRLLLARRLVREHRPAEARAFFTPELQFQLDAYLAHLEAGADARRDAISRGRDLFAAARVLRHAGLDLSGTELAPDFAIWSANFETGPDLSSRLKAGGAIAPSADEIGRATIPAALPDIRFHYRSLAAELAWQASGLYPDNHDELAALLQEAGGWLKARDPLAADRFYKALATRCAETALGRAAITKYWFP
jgi:hypothetical protein